MGIDILGIDIMGVDILGIDIPAPTPWEGGIKVNINVPGSITKMAAMPIYD